MRPLIIASLLCLLTFHLRSQIQIEGLVTDAENNKPVDAATVQLQKKGSRIPVNYTLTDAEGHFIFPAIQVNDSMVVRVSLLGYGTMVLPVVPGEKLHFQLSLRPFSLKEVEIRPGRIYGRQDTINYDVSRFISPKDESVKDILKRLPGIQVNDAGKISYNGKDISRFYVEGMDLSDGRYGQISNNLQANAVETVQVLENHQPIRVLSKKISTEDIALNLKLKPQFRNRWLINLEGGTGGSPILWSGNLNAMQLSRKSQSVYLYKGNNTGNDVTDEQRSFRTEGEEKKYGSLLPTFLKQPSLSAPLKKERLLFNQVHTLSANRLYKLNETAQLRINANYVHDLRSQQRGSITHYYQEADTLTLKEESNTQIRNDRTELAASFENNTEDLFLTNHFNLTGNWENSLSHIQTGQNVTQRIQTPDFGVRNYLQGLWTRGKNTIEARSLVRYHNLPARIGINDYSDKMNLHQLYIDHSLLVLRKKGMLTQRYAAGVSGDINNLHNGFTLYAIPEYQWNLPKWSISFNLPFRWTAFPGTDISHPALNPYLSILYKLNYAWRFSARAEYKESYGDITHLYTSPYRTSFRNRIVSNGILPVERRQSYALYGEYKSTVHEFFLTLYLNYITNRSNRIFERRIEGEEVSLLSLPEKNDSYNWSLNGTLSKGFYDWGTKFALSYLIGRNKAEQLSDGKRLPFRSDYMQYEPKISWTPSRLLEINYQSTIYYGGSRIGSETHLNPLLNVVQKFGIIYSLAAVDIQLTLDHYHNDISRDKSADAFFAHIFLRWKTGKWQLTADATNLFNKKEYRYTQYSTTESYTSWLTLRPREFLVKVRYKF
ncbi:TonB-dependent receptor [Parabacteroides sp. W1-Q-101]|nr:carboxypeptidase regulatory-like domain-containing protein [Parabacteroides sp. W1-Q-101]MCM0720786.1 TonB-dependent receptor [Parabacteroides sp. W1-Q-101]